MAKTTLGEFEILILGALLRLGDDAYGVAVRREIHECTERDVSIAAVYTTLGRLEKKGYVRSRLGAPTAERGGRAKRYFEALPEGRAAFAKSLRAFDRIREGLVLP